MKFILKSLIIILCSGFFSLGITTSVFAEEYGKSIPMGPSDGIYALTGTIVSSEASIGDIYVFATGASTGLFYDKNSKSLTGNIYSTGIGLIEVTSTTNPGYTSGIKVCYSEADLASISAPCAITASGGSVIQIYSPAIGTLTGSNGTIDVSTKETRGLDFQNIGFSTPIFSLSGINLLPKSTNLTGGDFGTGVYFTTHSGEISIDNGSSLVGVKSMKMIPTTLTGSFDMISTHTYSTSAGSFTGVDLSIPGNYIYELTIDGVISRGLIKVIASEVATSFGVPDEKNTFLYKYCLANKTDTSQKYANICPEKEALITSKTYFDTTKKANNNESNTVKILLRDKYGNRTHFEAGFLEVDITRTLTGIYTQYQHIPSELGSIAAATSFEGLRIASVEEASWTSTDSSPKKKQDFRAANNSDPFIQIFSSASGSLKVDWKVETLDIHIPPTRAIISSISTMPTSDITFEGLIKDNGLIISPILRNRESVFSHKYLISDSGSISTPHLEYIITTSSGEIVDRIRSAASDTCNILNNTGTTSTPNNPCEARNRDFSTLSGEISNTLFRTNLPKTNSGTIDIGLTFATGAMTSTGTNTGYLIVMASYKINGQDILYPLVKRLFNTAESTGTIPLKILGQIGSSDLGTSMKSLDLLSSNLINTERDKIRKQAQMMRQDFVSSTTPWVIDSSTNTSKQIYIFEGDIVIKKDIGSKTDKPKVFIALKKSDGTGGNIWIDPSVKDIIASLIADGSIFSGAGPSNYVTPATTDKQLYIYGSIMSNNTIGGFELGRCPRNAIGCTEGGSGNFGSYDFEKMRGFNNANSSQRSSGTTETASFVIEHDPRLVQDSPLVLMRDLTR